MRVSPKGVEFIKLHEGFRAKAYLDPVGVLTIGYGATSMSQAFKSWWSKFKSTPFDKNSVVTKQEATDALEFMLAREYGTLVEMYLGNNKVPQHVFDAMVSVVYNVGGRSLQWKWAKEAKAGNYELAAKLLSKTGTTAKDRRTGQRKSLPGLVRRRKEEALVLSKGIYTGVSDTVPATNPVVVPTPKPTTTPVVIPVKKQSMWAVFFNAILSLFRRK